MTGDDLGRCAEACLLERRGNGFQAERRGSPEATLKRFHELMDRQITEWPEPQGECRGRSRRIPQDGVMETQVDLRTLGDGRELQAG